VTRMLVDLSVRSTVINVDASISWGITIVDEDAFAAAALPDVNDETEQPGWMFRGADDVSASNVFDRSQFRMITANLSGQRKFAGNSSRLVFLLNNSGASPVIVAGLIRMLVKKP